MTYYEWVNLFDKIKKSPRNDDLLNELAKQEMISYSGNAKTLFVNHIVDLINERLKSVLTNFVSNTKMMNNTNENLSLQLNEIKNEIAYLRKIISFKYVPDDKRIDVNNYLNNHIESVEQTIKNSFKNNLNNDINLIVNNFSLKEVNSELQ